MFMTIVYIVFIVIAIIAAAIRILKEYERGVIFTLGRFTAIKGPGLIIVIPFVQQMVKVDLRTVVLDVPPSDVISMIMFLYMWNAGGIFSSG